MLFTAQSNGKAWGCASNMSLTYTFSSRESVDLRKILLAYDPQMEALT
jgi:hypothetical protein